VLVTAESVVVAITVIGAVVGIVSTISIIVVPPLLTFFTFLLT